MKPTPISRRDWLKLSAAGVLAGSTSGWLVPRLAHAAEGDRPRPNACILLFMNGGPSQHHTFHVPEKEPDIAAIPTAVPGIAVSEFFPNVAAAMKDITLVRGMSTGNSVHERARVLMHTG